jgi:cation diffusion facilitator family transporter
MDHSLKIAAGSLVVSLLVLGIKYVAWLVTGSVALYSDALESIVNVVTAGATIVAIRSAAHPPDAEHPYGHEKAEYLSAMAIGALIVAAGLAILWEAYGALRTPHTIETPWGGMVVNAGATALNIGWGGILIRQGRRRRSAALVADGKHLLTDVITSLGVLAGVALVVLTGIEVLDPAIAVAVALYVLWSGWSILTKSMSSLLDEAAPAEELRRIREVIAANAGDALEMHDLRTRHGQTSMAVPLWTNEVPGPCGGSKQKNKPRRA